MEDPSNKPPSAGSQPASHVHRLYVCVTAREKRESTTGKNMREQSAALMLLCATCWGHSKQPAGSHSRAAPSSTLFMCFVKCLTPPSFMSDTRSYFSWTGKVSQGQLSWTYCLSHFGIFKNFYQSVPPMMEESDWVEHCDLCDIDATRWLLERCILSYITVKQHPHAAQLRNISVHLDKLSLTEVMEYVCLGYLLHIMNQESDLSLTLV